MTTALSTWLSKGEIRDRIGKAIGKAFDPDFYIEQILIALNHPDLSECSEESKFKAAHTCAALGMLPSMQHVALIPRKLKGQGTVCTVMPQWQGLGALMLRHPDVERISHSLVHPSDDFEYDGTTQTVLRHQFDPFSDGRQFVAMNDVRGGYLTIFFKDGRPPIYHMVKRSTIEKARQCAQADNIWRNWFEEQCIKTLYRNGFARRIVPIDPMLNQLQLQAAMNQEDEVLGNDPNRVDPETPKVIEQSSPPVSRTAAIAQQMPATSNVSGAETGKREAETAFHKLEQQVLAAATIEELEAVFSEVQMSAEELAEGELETLQKLIDSASEGLKQPA